MVAARVVAKALVVVIVVNVVIVVVIVVVSVAVLVVVVCVARFGTNSYHERGQVGHKSHECRLRIADEKARGGKAVGKGSQKGGQKGRPTCIYCGKVGVPLRVYES